MFEFDLQRFDEESTEQSPQPETQAEEKPIPEELSGLPEDIARETLAEWEKLQPKPEEEPQPEEPPEPKPQTEESVPYARFKEKVDEANQLKAQPAPKLPRADQLKGSSGASDGQLSAHDIEKLLEGDFTTLDEKTRKMLLGLS